MLLKFQVLFLDLIDSDAYHIDHVAENSSADHLYHCDHDGFDEIVGSEVPVAHCHHGCIGPVEGVDVMDIPRSVLEVCLL